MPGYFVQGCSSTEEVCGLDLHELVPQIMEAFMIIGRPFVHWKLEALQINDLQFGDQVARLIVNTPKRGTRQSGT